MTENQFQMDAAEVAAVVSTGYRLFEQGRLKEARLFFEGLTLLEPENAYAHGILGAINQREKNEEASFIHIRLRFTLPRMISICLPTAAKFY